MIFYHAGKAFLTKNYGIIVNNMYCKTQICGSKILVPHFSNPNSVKYFMFFYHTRNAFLNKNYAIIMNNMHNLPQKAIMPEYMFWLQTCCYLSSGLNDYR